MMKISRQNNEKLVFVTILSLFFLFIISSTWAVEGTPDNKNIEPVEELELNFDVVKGDYEYQIENRPDPFVPFFTGESTADTTLDPNEIIDPNDRLTGMQLFEPGQLTLVALLSVKGRFIAMVEDFTGRGYIIKEGMKIGRRGVIKSIVPNKVIIEEVAVTRAGKELISEIVMALRKEGEE